MRNHNHALVHLKPSNEMILSRFLFSLGLAAQAVVLSLYLSGVGFSDGSIGIISGLASLLVVLVSPLTPHIIEKTNGLKSYQTALILTSITVLVMALTDSFIIALVALLFFKIVSSVAFSAGGITFRDVSGTKKEYLKSQGKASSLMNVGWLLGPILGGLILTKFDIPTVLFFSSAMMIFSVLVPTLMPLSYKPKKFISYDTNWIENIKFYFKKKNLPQAYLLKFGVQIWWTFIWTFVPLFMLNQGYSYSEIGWAVGITQLPLFLLEFKTVDFIKPWGYKKILFWSFILMTAIMTASALYSSIPVVITLLLIGSLALAFLEPISEIFFFDQITSLEEEKAYPIYSTSAYAGGIVGGAFMGVVLLLTNEQVSYAVMAVLMALIAASVLTIKEPKHRPK